MKNRWENLASRCFLTISAWTFLSVLASASFSEAKNTECPSVESRPVKVEAWLSKRYKKELRQLRKEFTEMGNTRAIFWVYPSGNPSRVVAIGRCVPAIPFAKPYSTSETLTR